MAILIKAGSTSRKIEMTAWDVSTGLPYVTAAYNDGGIALWYRRGAAGAIVAITPASQTIAGAWTSGGFVLTNAANNSVRLDVPDAAFAAGVDEVVIGGTATAWKLIPVTVQLVGYDPRVELTTAALANLDAAVSTRATVTALATAQTSLNTIAAYIDTEIQTIITNIAAVAAAVWAYATRTLSQGAASVATAVTGSTVTVYRGTRWSISLTGLTTFNTSTYTSIIVSVKRSAEDADSAAIFQVRKNRTGSPADGLTYFENAPTITAGQASITVDSATAITIVCEGATTQYAEPGTYQYAIKILDASGYPTMISAGGTFTIVGELPLLVS